MKHFLFLVEGPHDVAAISRILRINYNIRREITKIADISEVWSRLIPKGYPFNTEGILDRTAPYPSFFQNENLSIAIKVANSDSKLFLTLDRCLKILERENKKKIDGIIIFCDADNEIRQEKIKKLIDNAKVSGIESFDVEKIEEDQKIYTDVKEIKSKIYTFPNNKDEGRLEDILLQGAKEVYKDLLDEAENYVKKIPEKYKNEWTESSENKVVVGCMANAFKPGRPNQASINDNDWISATTMECEYIHLLSDFITSFIND